MSISKQKWFSRLKQSCKTLLFCGRDHCLFNDGKYVRDGQCEKKIICGICGRIGYKIIHDWGDWDWPTSDSCEQQSKCQNCDETEKRIRHVPDVGKKWSEFTERCSADPELKGLSKEDIIPLFATPHCVKCREAIPPHELKNHLESSDSLGLELPLEGDL